VEAQKEFHFNDAFYIAERLDAIQNALPIPPHTEKEFHSKDNYIIWTKLSAPVAPISNKYGQIVIVPDYALFPGADFVWTSVLVSDGVNLPAPTDITIDVAGNYLIEWKLTLNIEAAP